MGASSRLSSSATLIKVDIAFQIKRTMRVTVVECWTAGLVNTREWIKPIIYLFMTYILNETNTSIA